MSIATDRRLAVMLPLAATGACLALLGPVPGASIAACGANALLLRVETGGGRFAGTSHDGGLPSCETSELRLAPCPHCPSLRCSTPAARW